MELEDPASLDKPIGTFDDEMAGYVEWQGKLELQSDIIGLSYWPSDAVRAEAKRQRRIREMVASSNPHESPVDPRVTQARDEGLLPPGA
jgi:hypothetical protein